MNSFMIIVDKIYTLYRSLMWFLRLTKCFLGNAARAAFGKKGIDLPPGKHSTQFPQCRLEFKSIKNGFYTDSEVSLLLNEVF